MWEMDTSNHEDGRDFDPEGGANFKNISEVGRYHAQVVGIDEAGGKDGAKLVIDLEVIGGRPKEQEGHTTRLWFTSHPNARSRLLNFAYAVGATTVEKVRLATEQNRPASIDFASTEGNQLVIDAEWGEDQQGNKRIEVKFGFFPVTDPKVESCLNKGMLLSPLATSSNDGAGADNPFGGSQSQDSQAGSQQAPSSEPEGGTAAKSSGSMAALFG